MHIRLWCLLVVGVVLHVNAGRKRNFAGKKKCHNRQFQRHSEDRYSYVGVIQNGLLGTTNNVTQMDIKANVFVTNDDGCEFFLKLSDVTLSEKIGKTSSILSMSSDFVSRLTRNGLRFTMAKGMVTSIMPSIESTATDVLNIQRGILSMLQVRQLGHRRGTRRMDNDVSGRCETEYQSRFERGQSHIEKIKDLNSCEERRISHTNIDGIPIMDDPKVDQDPLLKSASVCSYRINKSKKGGLKSVICKEHFLVRPFSSELGSGAYVSTRSSLSKTGSERIKGWKLPYKKWYVASIKYDSSAQHRNAHKPSFVQKVTKMINEMSKNDYLESKFKSAEKFFEMVTSIRHLNAEDIRKVMTSVDVSKESVRSHLFDALTQCGTPGCLGVLFESLQKYGMLSELPRLMPFLAFTKEPTPEVIRMIMGLRQNQKNPSLVLLISTLVYKMCQHRPVECAKKGTTIAGLVQDTEHDMLRLLGNDCRTKDKAKQNDIYYALKGIGNMGRPTKAIPLIHDCIKNAEHAYISVAAIQSLRRMKLTRDDREKFYDVLTNKNEHLEKRVELFLMLMKDPTDADIILGRDLSNAEDESGQLRSLINSYLRSAVSNTDPAQTSITNRFKYVLDKYELETFNPSSARYSKAFIHSANLHRFASTASGMSLFHPESFVPRTANLNLTMHMFGYSINPFEVTARMEGMEMVLPKYFGKDGYFGAEYLKKLFKIPDEKLGEKERTRRSVDGNSVYDEIDKKVNMKSLSPQAMISLKVFGNEIQILTLDDLPFLKGELGNRNIIKDLYELTKGKQKTMKQNLILLEVSHAVPTIIGIPLTVAVNVSAVVTLDVKGKVTTKNILFGPKAATIEGSVKPSISVHASGKVSVGCVGFGNIGTSFQANMHAAEELSGTVEYEEGKDVMFDLNAKNQVNDIMNVSYNLFHETTRQREPINGVSKRVKGLFCTSDFMDSTAVFGTNTCMEVSFPVAYYNLSVPYFPLTGPLNFGIRSYPVDPLLTKYRMIIKKDFNLYTISISTPGSSYERDYEIQLGAAKEGSWTVGFSCGKERKGIVLSTEFKKETNEAKATFASNITQLPIYSEIRFFNETDPETFGRTLGGAMKLQVGKYYSNHRIYYVDTYDHVAIGGRFEYMRDQVASLELKVQYEPQKFSFKFNHTPTNTHVLAYGIPNIQLLEGGLDVVHGKEFRLKSHGKLDIARFQMDGYVNVEPIKYLTKVNAYLDPKEKTFNMKVNANGVPFTWVGSLKKVGYNIIENVFNISNKIVTLENKWSSKLNGAFIKWDNFQAGYDCNINLSDDGYEEIGTINYNGTFTKYNYNVQNTMNKKETCITGNIVGANKFGNCVEMYTGTFKKGYLVRVINSEGKWIQPASFLMNTPADGSVEAEFKIMQHYLKYKKSGDESAFELSVMNIFSSLKMKKTKSGREHKDFVLYANLFDMTLSYKQDEKEEGKDIYNLRLTKDKFEVHLQTVLKAFEEKFQYTFGFDLRGYGVDMLYNVILKDSYSIGGDNKLYRKDGHFYSGDIIIDYDTSGNYLRGIEYRPGKNPLEYIQPFQFVRDITDGKYEALFQMKSKAGGEFEEKVVYSLDTSTLNHKLKIPVGGFVEMFIEYVNERIVPLKQGLPVIAQVIGLERSTIKELHYLLLNGTKEYFMTFECNGEQIKKKFLTVSTKDMLGKAFTKIVFYPYTPRFIQMMEQMDTGVTKVDTKTLARYLKNIAKLMKESILSVTLSSIKDALTEYVPVRYRSMLPINEVLDNFSETFKNTDVFAKKFIGYIQTLINGFQRSYVEKLKGVVVKQTFSSILRYLPGHIKGKFTKILKKTIYALQNWKYNTTLTPLQNIKHLLTKLNKANFHHLFIFNHENIMVKILFQHVKFPGKIRTAVLEFIKNSNYTQLFTRLSKFVLNRYKVKGTVDDHIKNLMDSKTFKEFTDKFAKLEFDSLDTQPYGLFAQLRTILKDKYNIPDSALELIDELFSKVEIKKFSLKELPAMLVSNKIPNMIKKFFAYLQKNDLSEYLTRMLKIVLPGMTERIDEFVTLIEGDGKINEVLLGTYKLLVKTLKAYVKADISSLDRVSKYMEMLLSDKDVVSKLKGMLLASYDQMILKLNELFPTVMKELGSLPTKIRIHLDDVDVDMIRKNTSSVLLKVFDGIFKEVTDYFDAEFRAGLRDKVAELPRFVMEKLLNNKTLLKDYETRVQQLNLLYGMVTSFIDNMIRSGNGTFSIVAITKNVIEHLSSLEYDAITTVLNNLDITKYANLTYDTFMDGMKQFIHDIGTIKHGTKTINEHVQGFIINLKEMMKNAYEPVSGAIEKYKKDQERNKGFIRRTVNRIRGYIGKGKTDDNKMIKFVINVLAPGIDGLFLLDNDKKDQFKDNIDTDECLKNFMRSYNLTDKVLPGRLRKKLSDYKKSFECDVITFKDFIRKMKKDENFISNLLNKIELMLMKMFDENIQFADRYGSMIKSIMVGSALFDDTYGEKNGLGEIVFNIGEKMLDLLSQIDWFEKMMSTLQRSAGKISYKKLVEKYIIKYLRLLPTLMTGPVEIIDQFGNNYIFPNYFMLKAKFHNVTMLLNSGREFILDRISRFTNPENSEAYLKLLPEALSQKIKKAFELYQNKAISILYLTEKEIRKAYKQFSEVFEKYRGDIRIRLDMIKTTVKDKLSYYLRYASLVVEKYRKRLSSLLKPLRSDKGWMKSNLREKFALLSIKTRKMKAKYTNIKRQFVNDLRRSLWRKLSSIKWLQAKNEDVVASFLGDLDFSKSNQVLAIMKKDLKQIILDSMSKAKPHFMKFLQIFDAKVCVIKKMLSQLFPNKDGILHLSYNMKDKWLKDAVMEIVKKRDDVMLLKQVISSLNVGGYKYEAINNVLEHTFERGLRWYFQSMVNITRMDTEFLRSAVEMYANYSDQEPDVLLKQLLSKYEMEINRTMLEINKAFVMTPPAVIEKQIIRFLGLGYKPKKKMFEPLSRTAYLFERSLVTFDGKPILLPRDLNGKFFDCKFLLTRDFLWKNFTIYLQEGNFVVELQDAKVMINRRKDNEVTVVSFVQPGVVVTEFPVQFYYTTVTKLPNVLKIENVFGLMVYCQLDVFSCNITVPGYYHNKTLGLFGTNNVEYSDDLRMPNGKIALNIIEFANAFELTSLPKCVITSTSDIFGNGYERRQQVNRDYPCANHFVMGMPGYIRFESAMQQAAFRRVCIVEDGCSVSKAYISNSLKEIGSAIPTPERCGCRKPPSKLDFRSDFSSTKANLHITLLIKLVPEVSKARPQIKKMMQHIQSEFSNYLNIQFTVVGFSGSRVFKQPHIQTASGNVTYNVTGALKAMDLLQFNGRQGSEKLGISALQFAAPIKSKRGMKIFMLFENDASYTNLLPQLMDVSEILSQHGVILNVVNNYKMKPNVIAKDSHKTRYHLNLPKGEPFSHSVTFPPTDDYIPFMKQTGGAVFTLKAFTNEGAGWTKALPVSVTEVLRKQIDQDVLRCKECVCDRCKNVAKEECDYGLSSGRSWQ